MSALVLEDPAWLRREGEEASKNPPGSHPRGGDDLSNESVDNITVPTLLMMAENGEGVPEVLEGALGTFAHGSKVYFRGCGHCIHCDAKELYLTSVREFLLTETGR